MKRKFDAVTTGEEAESNLKDAVFEDLKGALLGTLDSLEPAPYPPAETKAFEYVTFDVEKDNAQWRELIAPHLAAAKTFEIHCWVDETEEIAQTHGPGQRLQ